MTTEVEQYSGGHAWENNTANGAPEIHKDDWESGSSAAKLFERSRIKALAEERQKVQKKTFTKWVNSHLGRNDSSIEDLYVDLADGRMLIKLLEILSGERLPRPTKGSMRIHCLENVDKSLMFLMEQRVHLENVGAHDIVDCNPILTLGLIWTIILRFQIQDIRVDTEDSEQKSAKDALLLWCQIQTKGYQNVSVRDFSRSWRDGLAFNAIIHKHRPDLIDFKNLRKNNPVENLETAFTVAQTLGIDPLLDVEDVNQEVPEEKSIMTYVASYYHMFSKMKHDSLHGRRIGKVIDAELDIEKDIIQYESLTSDLLQWIKNTIEELNKREFRNNLPGVQSQLSEFNSYRTTQKPSKFIEKGNLEILLFTIQSKQRANNQKPYMPREERMISDINKAWEELERAEHERELKLREEILRQEKLVHLAARFDRKALLRADWLNENQRLVSQENFGQDLAAVEAAMKKHEAIETDIRAYEERVLAVATVADELEKENYHDIDRINHRRENVNELWAYLLELLKTRRAHLELTLKLHKIFQEMLYQLDWMDDITARLQSEDYGRHLMGVRDLIQKHALLEQDIKIVGERVTAINKQARDFIDGSFPEEVGDYRPVEPSVILDRIKVLEERYAELLQLAADRRSRLGESECLWQFYWNVTEEESWIKEKITLMDAKLPDPDDTNLTSAILLKNKHKANENELIVKRVHLDSVLDGGKRLVKAENLGANKIQGLIDSTNQQWEGLMEVAELKRTAVDQLVQFNQFKSDAADIHSTLATFLSKLDSPDVGHDESSAMSLLKKHNSNLNDLHQYNDVIKALHNQGDQLAPNYTIAAQEDLRTIDNRYKDLVDLAKEREEQLKDALSLYQLFNEADAVEQWINEKNKLLSSMTIRPKELEEVEIIGARFVIFEEELKSAREKVENVNDLAQHLITNKHPNSEEVQRREKYIKNLLDNLEALAEEKRSQLKGIRRKTTWQIECTETITWIKEKTKVIESTDELSNDLAGIMQLQRRLSGLENDLAAIQARLNQLEQDADALKDENPEEAEAIRAKISEVKSLWTQLTVIMQERDEKLSVASELQKFLGDLDHFQQWLDKTQAQIASGDFPNDVTTAEKLLSDHRNLNDEIDGYSKQYESMREYGENVVADKDEDPQYVLLKERLHGLDEGWENLRRSWKSKQNKLVQNLDYQIFLRDAKQVELMLSQQDNFLAKDVTPTKPGIDKETSTADAENLIKKNEQFLTTLDAQDERIDQVLQDATRLQDENHYASDLIKTKADAIDERRKLNRQKALDKLAKLRSQLELQQQLQDYDELKEWIEDRKMEMDEGPIPSVKDRKIIHNKYQKHEKYIAEIHTHKTFLEKLIADTEKLISEKPETAEVLRPRLEQLKNDWNDLENAADERRELLLKAQGPAALVDTCDEVDSWITNLECQIDSDIVPETPTTLNLLIQKQNILESELQLKQQQVEQLSQMAVPLESLPEEEKENLDTRRKVIQERFIKILDPLKKREAVIEKEKRKRQFLLAIEDEKSWIQERLNLANSPNMGNSLQTVQMLERKNQALRNDMESHLPAMQNVCDTGRGLINELAPEDKNRNTFQDHIDEVEKLWVELEDSISARDNKLAQSEEAQKYLFDAREAETWMSEQELLMMADDKAHDEFAAENVLKKHGNVETVIEDFSNTIKELGNRARDLIQREHPDSETVGLRQSQIDKLFASLKHLCVDRRARLDDTLKLYILQREIDDLLQWILDRELIASSKEQGHDLENITMMIERFKDFSRDTEHVGQERVAEANDTCDRLMSNGHHDGPIIAQYKDNVNEAWSDLLELIDTRTQELQASYNRHKFLHDCSDVLERIREKKAEMSDELGKDAKTVASLQRRHKTFENDLISLGNQVREIQEECQKLIVSYSGEPMTELLNREKEVIDAWNSLEFDKNNRKMQLDDASDLYRFFNMIRDLLLWTEDMIRQIKSEDKPRDVSGVELLMNNHKSLRAEIDARDENFAICVNLGKDLVIRRHPRTEEIRSSLRDLALKRGTMMDSWEDRWDFLQLMLEVYQFARDATVAEQWLITHEAYVKSRETGNTLPIVDALLKKHEAFEKTIDSQEGRFMALKAITLFERMADDKDPISRPTKVPSGERYVREYVPPLPAPSPKVSGRVAPQVVSSPSSAGSTISPLAVRGAEGGAAKGDISQVSIASKPESLSSPKTKNSNDETDLAAVRRPISEPVTTSKHLRTEDRKKAHQSMPAPGGEDQFRAQLNRKHEWEAKSKKASNRAWEKLFCEIVGHNLRSYKDNKFSKFRDEMPLIGVQAGVASDYNKRPHVFRLKYSQSGAHYIFQCKDDTERDLWINRIIQVAGAQEQGATGSPSRTQTLPASASRSAEKDSGKKKIFSLSRKK